MKGETRAQRPTLASFQGGRIDARNSRLLERIQERQANGARQATLTLGRMREGKPALYGQQASVLVLNTGTRRSPVEREAQAVSFEGTGKVHRGRTGPLATAIAAGLLVLIAPNLSGAEKPEEPTGKPTITETTQTGQIVLARAGTDLTTLAPAVLGTLTGSGNDLDFRVGTTVEEALRELENNGYIRREGRRIVEGGKIFHAADGLLTVILLDGIPKVFTFTEGKFRIAAVLDFLVEGANPTNYAYTAFSSGQFFTAEGFIAEFSDGSTPAPVVAFLPNVTGAPIHFDGLDGFGGVKNPRFCKAFQADGVVLLHAFKDDGTPWDYVRAYSIATGEYVTSYPYQNAKPFFDAEEAAERKLAMR